MGKEYRFDPVRDEELIKATTAENNISSAAQSAQNYRFDPERDKTALKLGVDGIGNVTQENGLQQGM